MTQRAAGRSTTKVLYLGGLGRSGSTLLEHLLAQGDGVHAVGELNSLWQRRLDPQSLCGCGRTLGACPVWGPVLNGLGTDARSALDLQQQVARLRHLPLLLAAGALPHFARRVQPYAILLDRIYADLTTRTGASVLIDSSKAPANAVLLRQVPGLDVRVVHLVRDPRGVAYSWSKSTPMEPRADSPLMARFSPGRTAWQWLGYNAIFATLGMFGVPVLRVRYEDLIDDPVGVVAGVFRFAGMPTEGMPRFIDNRTARLDRVNHTVAGNPVRFQRDSVRIELDDEWRTGLPRRARWAVTGIALPLLARYGYLRRSSSCGRDPRRTADPFPRG